MTVLLDPEMERRLAGLRFHFVHSMDGRLTGVHRSAQPGISVEFSEHKEYSPGDDLRHLDWRAYARLDRFYVRQFTKETHANVHLLLDASRSMGYRSEGTKLSKLEFSARLVAVLSYLFLRQNDAVGLLSVRGKSLLRYLPTRSHPSQLVTIQDYVREVIAPEASPDEAEGPTSLAEGLEFLVSRRVTRSAVVVLSDFQMDMESLFPYLAYLHTGGNYCWLIHVVDPAEYDLEPGGPRTFPFVGTMQFRSPETGHGVTVDSRLARQDYIARFASFLKDLRGRAAELSVELSHCNTDEDPVDFMIRFLIDNRPAGE